MVSSHDLKKALDEGTWLDTNLMYYYFEILRDGCPTAFIADPSISSWWLDGSKVSIEAAFGKHGHRVMEARECHTLVFVLHYRNHFTLVVGYVDESRWEFYNSLDDDRLARSKAEQFIGWLNAMYMHFGWTDPFLWPIVFKEDIPYQDKGNDCGIFAVAFAEHCVHRRPITFTQSDIPYFWSRIVIELFKKSWQVNANRLNLPALLNLPV